MKNWKYKVQSSPQEVLSKLDSALTSAGGFNFSADKDSTSFTLRKPVKYPDQILHRNRLIVNGKFANSNSKNESETDLEISFAQDFYMKMTVFSMIVLAAILLFFISKVSGGIMAYLLGGLVFIVGIIFRLALQRKLERDAQKYKSLISEILEPEQ